MKKTIAIAFSLLVSACAEGTPVVTQFNGNSVTIQRYMFAKPSYGSDPDVVAEANRICSAAGKRAEFASTQLDRQAHTANHLFLCL
ncbi:hypothetical protein JF540_12890 [Salipiger thiooxidans]|uniref:hypothetical protein n=1 Tax=Salipiger thiooxidans TaxID=282683 RepID=UPI001A8D4910|nr:hypothetical protein [Salipiger thiooxidans]MBN8187587.1 hypothetical protein [Salipiger thiooxidans]